MNLANDEFVDDNVCLNCTRFPKTVIHTLWDCEVAKDVSCVVWELIDAAEVLAWTS